VAVSAGANIVKDGLIFAFDAAADANFGCTISTNKYGTTTTFLNAVGSSYEADSNPTNEIILLANPSNYSPYVLRQNGNYTEYQINLTTELAANTTYVLSGWYAKSANYNGSDTMFHCRAFSSSGNHVALGTGIGTTIKTQVVGGLTWSYVYTTITTPSDYSNSFHWYVGYGQPTHNGYRYYANLKMEEGTFPTQKNLSSTFHATPRNGVTYDTANGGCLVFDGTNDYLTIANDTALNVQTPSVEVWIKTNALNQNGFWFEKGSVNTQFSLFQEGTNIVWRQGSVSQYTTTANFISTSNWAQIVGTYTSGNRRTYINGVLVTSDSQTGTVGTNNSGIRIGSYLDGGYFYNGRIAIVKVYNKVLSAAEVLQNFNAQRDRFGI